MFLEGAGTTRSSAFSTPEPWWTVSTLQALVQLVTHALENTRPCDVNPFECHFQSFHARRDFECRSAFDPLVDDELAQALGEVLHPLFLTDPDRVAELGVFSLRISLRTVGFVRMISLVGTRVIP